MKADVIQWVEGHTGHKPVCKETLNHPDLIALASGLDVYENTPEAYRRAYQSLGIDLINRVPLANAPAPTRPRSARPHPDNTDYELSHLGVYDTAARMRYSCKDEDELWDFDISRMELDDLITPVPHPCDRTDIRRREGSLGNIGAYFPMLYTTLFMWPVELLGWEVFMLAAFEEPERFFNHVLRPCIEKSRRLVEEIVEGSSLNVIFVHDDICDARGPVFPPDWYETWIFPHYSRILEPAVRAGRKIVLVADGNVARFLPRLKSLGFAGLMFECPATPLEKVLESYPEATDLLIGGIDTVKLSTGTPDDVTEMVHEVMKLTAGRPGFALSSCGGIHGDIPLENLEAYFDTRALYGINSKDWRSGRA